MGGEKSGHDEDGVGGEKREKEVSKNKDKHVSQQVSNEMNRARLLWLGRGAKGVQQGGEREGKRREGDVPWDGGCWCCCCWERRVL